jgi:uncharacterized metal-binding protein YceD (DUF177 family)
MYSTRCSSCAQLITLSNDEIKAVVAEAEAHGHGHYTLNCIRCRRPIKVPVKMLRLKLPRPKAEQAPKTEEKPE